MIKTRPTAKTNERSSPTLLKAPDDRMPQRNNQHLEMFLFTTDVAFALRAEAAGIDAVVVDWEHKNKSHRQNGYDTQVNIDTPRDVAWLAESLSIPVLVRVEHDPSRLADEIECALDHGARAIMLPMATTPGQVQRFVDIVAGRVRTVIQIETQSLVDQCRELNSIGWDAAYIGLNDLMISRGGTWIWESIADGTVERIFELLPNRAVGFGGITIVGGGMPMPFVDLLREMARLGCRMSFLRRSFIRDIANRDMVSEIALVRAAWHAANQRSPQAEFADRRQLGQVLNGLCAALKSDTVRI